MQNDLPLSACPKCGIGLMHVRDGQPRLPIPAALKDCGWRLCSNFGPCQFLMQ